MKKYCQVSLICCSLDSELNSNFDRVAMDVGILPNQVSDIDTSIMSYTTSGMFNSYHYLNLIFAQSDYCFIFDFEFIASGDTINTLSTLPLSFFACFTPSILACIKFILHLNVYSRVVGNIQDQSSATILIKQGTITERDVNAIIYIQ